jgi:hypothetical protein
VIVLRFPINTSHKFINNCLYLSIWNHLVRQSVDHGRTVIVTTHYIEEARQANTVAINQMKD